MQIFFLFCVNTFTMSNCLLPQVKLPYKYVRGTIQYRQGKAAQLTDYFYRNLRGQFKDGKISLAKIQDCVDSVMPSRIKVSVRNLLSELDDTDVEAYSDTLYSSSSGKINVLTIELPTVDNKISIQDLPALMHEFQHVADQIFHPKILSRNQDLARKGLCTDEYRDLYETYIYNYEAPESKREHDYILKRMEQVIKSFMSKMSPEEKAGYLQDSRYCLMLEENAYHTQYKYAKKLKKQHVPLRDDSLIKENKDYMFAEKIELLNNMLASLIRKERLIHRSKLNHEKAKQFKKVN